MVQKIIKRLKKNNALLEVSILKAVLMLVSAWNAAPSETIVSCFRKAGISTANQAAIAGENYPFKNLQNEVGVLQNLQPDLIPEHVNTASLTDIDVEISVVQLSLKISKYKQTFLKPVILAMELTK